MSRLYNVYESTVATGGVTAVTAVDATDYELNGVTSIVTINRMS